MSYLKKDILTIQQGFKQKKVIPEELWKESVEQAKKYQKEYNCFVTILDQMNPIEKKDTLLSGIPYALKDNFSTKDILTTASSNILKDYIPVFSATAYKKLKEAGATLVGKTVLDELAMGGTGTTGHTGIVLNPWDKNRIIGGSSAGSAAAVALGIVPFALGSDTGDSIRKPASFGGVVGFKPTYGRISRYGLFAFASSLDHVGTFTRNVEDAAIVTDILKGKDEHDMTTLPDENILYQDNLKESIKGKKLFYIKEVCNLENYIGESEELIETLTQFHQTLEKLSNSGFIIDEVSVDKNLLNAIYPTYMTISCAEATSNNANLTGISFGTRGVGDSITDLMFSARTNGFSELIKRRFILGSYILQKENQEKLFLNAGRIRRMIVDKMNDLFETYDGMIMPTSGGIAPLINQSTDQLSDRYLILENHLAIGNFGGFPSITLPSGFVNKMPISVNLTCKVKMDSLLLNMAYKIEETLDMKNLVAEVENHV